MIDKKEVVEALFNEIEERLAFNHEEAFLLRPSSPEKKKFAEDLERKWSANWLKLQEYAKTIVSNLPINNSIEKGALVKLGIDYLERKVHLEELWFVYPDDFPGRNNFHEFPVGDRLVYLHSGLLNGKRSLLGAEVGALIEFPSNEEDFFEACKVKILEIS